jgi:hypothetical protein
LSPAQPSTRNRILSVVEVVDPTGGNIRIGLLFSRLPLGRPVPRLIVVIEKAVLIETFKQLKFLLLRQALKLLD